MGAGQSEDLIDADEKRSASGVEVEKPGRSETGTVNLSEIEDAHGIDLRQPPRHVGIRIQVAVGVQGRVTFDVRRIGEQPRD
jgi:hypothetical protein